MKSRILLVDLSGILHRNYAVNAGKGDIDVAANQTLSHVRWLAAQYNHVAICCDSGRSFRHDLAKQIREWDPTHAGYKGKRPPADPVLVSQMERVERELYAEGFHMFRAKGYEADDVIATLCAWARANGHPVDVNSEDKDLRALVTDEPPQVRVIRKGGDVVGPEQVKERFGVPPERLIECLAIAGDTVDGVPGVAGLGEGKAAKVLTGFGSFAAARQVAIDETADVLAEEALRKSQKEAGQRMDTLLKRKLTPSTRAALVNGEQAYRVSLDLVTLRTDVPIDCERVLTDRTPPPDAAHEAEMAQLLQEATNEADEEERAALEALATAQITMPTQETTMQPVQDAEFTEAAAPTARPSEPAAPQAAAPVEQPPVVVTPAPPATLPPALTQHPHPPAQNTNAAKPTTSTALALPDRPFNLQLEPRNMKEADWLANCLFQSKSFNFGTAAAAYAKIAVGRSMGLTLYQSLSLHMFQNKIVKPAMMIVAQVRQHPQCEYFRKRSGDATHAIWETKRRGDPRVMDWEFTIAEAREAGLVKPDSGWAKWAKNMCSWRAATFLAREEWAEVVGDFLTPEEVADMNAIDTTGEAA